MVIRKEIKIGNKTLSFETGKMAKQADGAVVVRYGDTVVLVTAVSAKKPREGVDFLPLTVDYRENTYAAGKIPGGFFRREGRLNEKEILTCRMIDRPLRPLFPDGWACETQIIANVLSIDGENDSDVLAITGSSFALGISNIPFPYLIASVRIGISEEGEYLVNPTFEELSTSKLDLIVVASEEAIVMVEAGANEVQEDELLEAVYRGHDVIRQIIACQKELIAEINPVKREAPVKDEPAGVMDKLIADWKEPLAEAMRIKDKLESYAKVDELKKQMKESFDEDQAEELAFASSSWHDLQNIILREEVDTKGRRLDGRAFDEIRNIACEVGVLPRTHGSALFTRGETQALVTATLGTSMDAQRIDFIHQAGSKRFMLHYNFPPFSVGEARFLRGPGRREIGHGALGERSLLPMVPGEDSWPYTMRVVSDILESNGSSSMATICGGSLALMDAGVPMPKAVAGIAMGLIKTDKTVAVLTDIAGAEDHHGDMDFKVAGTVEGITGLQMDIKIAGITREIMTRALAQAKAARLDILDSMRSALEKPRTDISEYAPRILTITVHKDKIRDIIGPGGKMIRSITERTGCKIEVNDDGRVDIASTDGAAAEKAIQIIKELTAEAELNKTYMGKVVRIVNFGAFIEILPGVDGLLHISEIAHHRVGEVTDEINEGDEVMVKVIDIDGQGRVRLSRKVLLERPEGDPVGAAREGGDRHRGDRNRGRGGDRNQGGRGGGQGNPKD